MRNFRLAVSITLVAVLSGAARSDEDPIEAKLATARSKFDTAISKRRDDVAAYFDAREAIGRKDGNKKLIDQLKRERTAFAETDTLPPGAPIGFKLARTTAAKELEAAYTVAAKELLRAKKDDLADAAYRNAACLRQYGYPLPAWGLTVPPGRYKVAYNVGVKAVTEIRPNGTFTRVKDGTETSSGRVEYTNGKLVHTCDTYVEVWTARDGKLSTEFYWPATTYPNGKIDALGSVEPVK